MKKTILFFISIYLGFYLLASNTKQDSLFFESFKLRYQNGNLGIAMAKELLLSDPEKAYLSMAFNYFYKSDYDSAQFYMDLAKENEPENIIIANMNKSLHGWINQRLGRYYKAYQYFNEADEFYKKNIKQKRFRNDSLFAQAYVINTLGNITFQFYYISDFIKLDSLLNKTLLKIESVESMIPRELKAHTYYIILQNYMTNLDSITQKPLFVEYFKKYISFIEPGNYYQKGSFYEILGLIYSDKNGMVKNLLNKWQNEYELCTEASQYLGSEYPDLDFLHKSLEYFIKHGDIYQIAGQFYQIGTFYRKLITKKLNAQEIPKSSWLDSLNTYIKLSLIYHHKRDINFFYYIYNDSVFFKKNSYSIIDNLTSLHWYIKILQLQHYFDGIKSDQFTGPYIRRAEGFNLKLLSQLEKHEKDNISNFFTEVEKTLNQKIKAEKSRNISNIAFLIFIIVALIAGTLALFYIRKRRRSEKEESEKKIRNAEINAELQNNIKVEATLQRNEEWNKILNELYSIREQLIEGKKEVLTINYKTLNNFLLNFFNAEYCAIGMLEKGMIHNLAHRFNYDLDETKEKEIIILTHLSAENSIIGNFLSEKRNFKVYKGKEIEEINNNYLKVYRNCLKSEKIENIHFAGFYGHPIEDRSETITFINLINVTHDANEIEEKLTKVTKELYSIFEGEANRKVLRDQTRDEGFITGLIAKEASIDEVVKESCKYIATEFNAGIVTFRVPVINGPDEEPENNLKLALRHIFVDPIIPNYQKIIDYYYNGEKKTLSLYEVTYKEVLLKDNPEDIFIDTFGQDEHFMNMFRLKEVFSTNTNIILPIRKLNFTTQEFKDVSDYWRNFCGIINVQPFKFDNKPDTLYRIKSLAGKIAYLLNNKFNKSKYDQINALHEQIKILDYEQVDSFYFQINELVRNVINADSCSIFIYNKARKRLELKATSAKMVLHDKEFKQTSEIKYKDDIYYNIDDKESITWKTFTDGKTHMIYNIKSFPLKSRKFVELPPDGNIDESDKLSRLFVPLKSSGDSGRCFGVIKCMGKRFTKEYLIHSFWDFDRETVEFISALAAQLIEYADFIHEKDSFIKQIVHETTTPITEMLHKQIGYYNKLKRDQRMPPGFEEFHNNVLNNIMLQKQILIDLEFISLNKSNMGVINPSKENTRQLLLDNIRLFEESAFFEKGLTFVAGINSLPDLYIDRSRMQQVFINLIRNTVNYSYPKTKIKILYELVDKYFEGFLNLIWHEIRFQNDGIGIPENEVNDIFLLYRRGSNASKMRPTGSGIGLFLVDQIVRAHGGICKVINTNSPTVISIFLPAKNK